MEWRGQNPPPATMMIISNQVGGDLSWDLARLQQRSQYNLFLAYSKAPCVLSVLSTSSRWLWEKLLGDNNRIETRSVQYKLSAMILCCKSCNFDCQSPEKFRKHLSSYKHARQVSILSISLSIHCLFHFSSTLCQAGVCIPHVQRS